MPLPTITIFVSSPGDVGPERLLSEKVISRLQNAFQHVCTLAPIYWEHEPLTADKSFQEGLISTRDTDIVICILWSRLGTRLPKNVTHGRNLTGTEFEILEALDEKKQKGHPDLLVYRKTAKPLVDLSDTLARDKAVQQYDALMAFWQRFVHDDEGALIRAFHTFERADEFEQNLNDHLDKIIKNCLREAGVSPEDGSPLIRTWLRDSPFRGLDCFDVIHEPIFFGRTRAVGEVVDRLKRQAELGRAFLLVTGMSGCGKSSLARAGVLAALSRPGVIEGVGLCRRAVLRPGDSPGDVFDALAASLVRKEALPELLNDGTTAADLARSLRANPDCIALMVKGAISQAAAGLHPIEHGGVKPGARLLFLVDQLEELFSLETISPDDRRKFAQSLKALACDSLSHTWVIATLRSDFYAPFTQIREFAELKEGPSHYDLQPPPASEIEQLISQPAQAAGVRFEETRDGDRLVDLVREEALQDSSLLPLLQFLLTKLYDRRTDRGKLTFEAYHALGGVKGALAQQAERTYQDLPSEVQQELSAVFRQLVTISTLGDETPTRRQVPLSKLEGTALRRQFVRTFIDARLLASDHDDAGTPVVRISRESLLTRWHRLQTWLTQDRELLLVKARLEAATVHWIKEVKRRDLLLPAGKQLLEAEQLQDAGIGMESVVKEYVSASLERASRNRYLRQCAVAMLCVLALAVGVFAVVAFIQKQNADTATNRANGEKIRADRAAAHASYDLGWQHAIGGDASKGLLWMALALREAPPEDTDLGRTLRTALGGWTEHVHALSAVFPHPGPVSAGAFSPDDRLVATVSEAYRTLTLWQVATKVCVGSVRLLFPCRVVFSRDSQFVGAISPRTSPDELARDRLPAEVVLLETAKGIEARQWDANSPLHTLRKKCAWHSSLLLDDGGVVLYGDDGTVRARWNAVRIREAEPTRPITPRQPTASARDSPTGASLEAYLDREVKLRTTRAAGSGILSLPHRTEVLAASFSRDGQRLLTGTYDGIARLWDSANGNPIGAPLTHGSDVTAVDFSADGRFLLTTSRDGTARVWRVSTGASPALTLRHHSPVFAAAFRPDGKEIATAGGAYYDSKGFVFNDRGIQLWDAESGKQTWKIECPGLLGIEHLPEGISPAFGTRRAGQDHTQIRSLAYSRDGHFLAAGVGFPPEQPWLGAVHLYDLKNGRWVGPPLRHLARVNSLAFSPDGGHLVSCTYDGDAWLWDLKTGQTVRQLFADERNALPILAVAFNPDGHTVATAGYDGTVRFWDVATGNEVLTRLRHAGVIHALAFSSDGKRIVTGSGDRTAQLWDVINGIALGPPMQHSGEVLAVALHRDGQTILTGSDDGLVQLWDVASGKPLSPPRKHRGTVHVVAFSPTNERILSGSSDGTACLWTRPAPIDGSPEEVMASVERMTGLRLGNMGIIQPKQISEFESVDERSESQ